MIKDLYILINNNNIYCYNSINKKVITTKSENFVEFCKYLIKNYNNYKLRCIINEGILEYCINKVKNHEAIYYKNEKVLIYNYNKDKMR